MNSSTFRLRGTVTMQEACMSQTSSHQSSICSEGVNPKTEKALRSPIGKYVTLGSKGTCKHSMQKQQTRLPNLQLVCMPARHTTPPSIPSSEAEMTLEKSSLREDQIIVIVDE